MQLLQAARARAAQLSGRDVQQQPAASQPRRAAQRGSVTVHVCSNTTQDDSAGSCINQRP